MRSTPREAIGLQLDWHLYLVRRRPAAGGALRLLRLGQNAEQILHVMSGLVRDNVGRRKLARLAADVAVVETRRDLVEERGVEIDLLVGGTVEGSHGALRFSAATGVRRAAIENEHGWPIDLAVARKDLLPLQVGAAEHLAHEAAHLVLRSAGASRAGRRLRLRPAGAGQDLGAADEHARIDAERPTDEAERYDRAADQSAAADRNATTAVALRASIFDIAAFREIVQAHG